MRAGRQLPAGQKGIPDDGAADGQPRPSDPHRAVSGKIWGYDSEVEVNVVWVYLSYLRKKLAALRADIQIRATRNTGYSLEELR